MTQTGMLVMFLLSLEGSILNKEILSRQQRQSHPENAKTYSVSSRAKTRSVATDERMQPVHQFCASRLDF